MVNLQQLQKLVTNKPIKCWDLAFQIKCEWFRDDQKISEGLINLISKCVNLTSFNLRIQTKSVDCLRTTSKKSFLEALGKLRSLERFFISVPKQFCLPLNYYGPFLEELTSSLPPITAYGIERGSVKSVSFFTKTQKLEHVMMKIAILPDDFNHFLESTNFRLKSFALRTYHIDSTLLNMLASLAPSLTQLSLEELTHNYQARGQKFYSSLAGFKKLRHLSLVMADVFLCFVSALYNFPKLRVLELHEYDGLSEEIAIEYAPLLTRYALELSKRKITFRCREELSGQLDLSTRRRLF